MFLVSLLPQNIKDKIKSVVFFSKCKFRKFFRMFFGFKNINQKELSFAILCVKNINYCNLVINNINSLHFLNPNHKFFIYCDELCANNLMDKIDKIDYQKRVEIRKIFGKGELPWQKYKIEVLIEASKNGYILTDADGIWHQEPEIVQNKINILTLAYKISDNENENLLVKKIFFQPTWSDFDHYVTGFVYVPSSFMTVDLQKDLRGFVSKILDNDLDFLKPENVIGIKRIAEELAVNFALQNMYGKDRIVVLKEKDGPGSNEKLQSLYYGCSNRINL